MRLKNRVAIITGSTSGIGKATAMLFAKHGAKVVITGRREAQGKKVVDQIKKNKGKAIFVKTDVTQELEVKNLVDITIKKFKKIDVLYCNAGIELTKSVTDTSQEEWDKVLNVNLRGGFFACKYVVPHMIKNKKGSIIFTSSVAGIIGYPNLAAYCASKGGVALLAKQVAVDYAKHNIRSNAICPGAIQTDMITRFVSKAPNPKQALQALAKDHPLGRMGQPKEIANLALFLASDESSFITGQAICADGGMTAQ